jgi:hypothetical protein
MTRLRIAFLLVAVVAGDYAALMLIDGQLIDFGVAAAICAGSSVAAGLIAYADDEDARRQHELGRRRRKAVTRERVAVYAEARTKNQVTHPDSLTGRPRAYVGHARRPPTQSRHDEPAVSLVASSDQ